MIRELVKSTVQRAGYQIIKASPDGEYRWSQTVEDYYPVFPRARWKKGSPIIDLLTDRLNTWRGNYTDFMEQMRRNIGLLQRIPQIQSRDPAAPFWFNPWFTGLDGAALVTFIAWKKPARIIEIGSGHSTRFARFALTAIGSEAELTSVDPNPRAEIDALCTNVVRTRLEECDLSLFDKLEAGDILFFDGSHRAFSNSDVVVFFFEVLPRLKSGVIVQIHDIFLPFDYPPQWDRRLYNEQYLLAAMLMCGKPPFEVLLPVAFVAGDAEFGAHVRDLFCLPNRKEIPFLNPDPKGPRHPGGSFWFAMK
jgi:hypothetical protein